MLFREYPDTQWMLEGTCAQTYADGTPVYDPEIWFPVGTTGPAVPQTARAVDLCRTCPVRATCLAWALETGQDAGIWGGTTEHQRRVIRRRRRSHAAARSAPEPVSDAPRPPRHYDEVAVARVLAGDPAAIEQERTTRDRRETTAYAMALQGAGSSQISTTLHIGGSAAREIVDRAQKDRVA